MAKDRPYLSFVTVTRNDNHGGDMTPRMNMFVHALTQQCDRYQLRAELILVEWNPPEDRPSLGEELIWPDHSEFLDIRIITIPRERHGRYKHAEGLPLYQMIGKNVGIRRAHGEFILATNVDILFDDALIEWLAAGGPERGYNYHVSRYDVDLPSPAIEEFDASSFISDCRENLLRICKRDGTLNLRTGDRRWIFKSEPSREHPGNRERLHTNACGDFALAHRDHWFETLAYPELDLYSFHIDSLWSYMAHFSGIREQVLEDPLTIYHLEHTGGFTPESLSKLDFGLKKRKVPRLENAHFNSMAFRMSTERRSLRFNESEWGLANEVLPESVPVRANSFSSNRVSIRENPFRRPRISLVVVARNDDHGGFMRERIQSFLDGWRIMASEEGLQSEIVFVEWNPPEDKAPIHEVLDWPQTPGVELRYITVSRELHHKLPNAEKIPLYQMIGKNIGARRSRGEWILMTNIDMLFNRAMIRFLRDAPLDRNAFYRAPRYDCSERVIPEELTVDDRIQFCENHLARVNLLNKTTELETGARLRPVQESDFPSKGEWIQSLLERDKNQPLYSSACGDFTMLHRDACAKLRCYPEIPIWSIYIDGLLLHAALANGMHQVVIGDPCRSYHIEHGRSWVVDTTYYDKDKRLDHKLHYKPWCQAMLDGYSTPGNPPDWGWAHLSLPETVAGRKPVHNEEPTTATSEVS